MWSNGTKVLLYTVSRKNKDTKLLFISSANIDGFLRLFHHYTQQEVCNKKIVTGPNISKTDNKVLL